MGLPRDGACDGRSAHACAWATYIRGPLSGLGVGAFLACDTIGSGCCLDGRLMVAHVGGAAGSDGRSIGERLGSLVEEALAVRAMRSDANAGDEVSFFLGRMPIEGDRRGISATDLKGLIGEIVAEVVLEECGYGEPFYSKWRHTGTSTSKGIDIVMLKGDALSASESKHLHALRPGRGASSGVSAAIAAAFRQSADRHTREWLLWLRRHCVEAARLGGATRLSPAGTAALLRMAEIITKALAEWSVSASAVVVLDARHGVDVGSIRGSLGSGTLRGIANPAEAVVSSIDGLHDATVRMVGRYC